MNETHHTTPPAGATPDAVLTPEAFLTHWQGHRGLTRRTIVAYPDDELFTFSAGGMRTFGALVHEMLGMVRPSLRGIVEGAWDGSSYGKGGPTTKPELLAAWDDTTRHIDEVWPSVTPPRIHAVDSPFGMWTAPNHVLLMYLVDNEIHHRGQGYVYLRMLGVAPPAFYER